MKKFTSCIKENLLVVVQVDIVVVNRVLVVPSFVVVEDFEALVMMH
jgi:hypothetical protein